MGVLRLCGTRRSRRLHLDCGALGLAAILAVSAFPAKDASAETRSFVVSWFHPAMYSEDGDCPDGLNPTATEFMRRVLAELGKSPAEIDAFLKDGAGLNQSKMLETRGRIDGKPVNVYINPTSVPDPHIKTAKGRFAYGFNLDGKGAATPNGFEDPDTHELGVNNEQARVMGCIEAQRNKPPNHPTYAAVQWDQLRDSMPAWLISISGDDLSKDGDVTVTFDRAFEHVRRNAVGEVRAYTTFRIDPSPRSHNVLHGTIKNGVATTDPANIDFVGEPVIYPEYHFHKARIRLTLQQDGTMRAILGGYHAWLPAYWQFSGIASSFEVMGGVDLPGLYYALRRFADAEPDPKTGQNMAISTAFWIEGVPAFTVPAPDKAVQAPLVTSQSR